MRHRYRWRRLARLARKGRLTTLDMESLAALAETAATAATAGGDLVAAARTRADDGRRPKAAGDYVTDTDLDSERAIRKALAGTGIAVVGEETEGAASGSGIGDAPGRFWVVDPLDGTTNFLHGFIAVGVSVALVQDGRPVVGVVHAPLLGRTWSGWQGGGAWEGSNRLAVSARPVEAAVVGTGFPFRRKENAPRYLEAFRRAFGRFEDLRRPGAAALDLAWVAEGVFDGFFELALGPWDVAAGALLIREAGGVVTDWSGDAAAWLRSGDILAGPPAVHEALLEVAAGS
jgi:myo-inositol-1(or 4)-monophosphatase